MATTVRAKKYLGQHFLTSVAVARRIASTLDECHGMPVLEIGPGMGILTRELLDKGHNLSVIEIDSESVAYLRKNFADLDGRHIIEGDFLKIDLGELFAGGEFCVIGNYPYNISSQIFFRLLEVKDRVPMCSGMLQKEVAERLAAEPGARTRGILSVLLQLWYDVKYRFTVEPDVFSPPPKVRSGVITLSRNNRHEAGCDETLLKTVVKTTFSQRRKTLRNSIKPLLPPGSHIDDPLMNLRPEALSVDDYIKLTNIVTTLTNK